MTMTGPSIDQELARLQEQIGKIHDALDQVGVPRNDDTAGGLQLTVYGRVRWFLDRSEPTAA